jgi:hypothetical protein
MTETPARSGGLDGTSAAIPADLQKAGRAQQNLSNVTGGILETPDLPAGGDLEVEAVQFPGEDGDGFGLPSCFTNAVKEVTQGYLGVLLNCRQQFADAAVDLMQVAGDFHTADHTIPAGVVRVPDPPSWVPKGVTVYEGKNGEYYYKDSNGTVVTAPGDINRASDNDDNNNPYEQVVGQTYEPPTGSR